MKKAILPLLLALTSSCSDGDDFPISVGDNQSSITNASNNKVLNIVWRCYMTKFGPDGDHMDTNKRECPPGTNEGQLGYLYKSQDVGTIPWFRLFKASSYDHMTSFDPGEGGYKNEFPIGYALDSSSTGTCNPKRWFSPSQGDHVTAFCGGENPGTYGYSQDTINLGHMHQRFGKSGEKLLGVNGDSVTVRANLVAGGAITELWWNGKQFINDWDFGRQVQTAVSLQGNTGSSETDNPTEAGDKYGWPGSGGPSQDASFAHGSPTTAFVSGKTLSTETRPLQWNPANFGGDQDHPVIWGGKISKKLTLDYGSSNTIRYDVSIYFPMAQDYVRSEVVTAYLTSDFTKFYTFDAATNKLVDITANCPAEGTVVNGAASNGYAKFKGPQHGGIIVATADGKYSLGGYHRSPSYEAWYQCGNFTNRTGSGKYGDAATKWSIFGEYPGSGATNSVNAKTTKSYTNYLTVGSLATSQAEMRRLYLAGN